MLRVAAIVVAILIAAAVLLSRRTAVVKTPLEATEQVHTGTERPSNSPAIAPSVHTQNDIAAALAQALAKSEDDAALAVADLIAEWSQRDPRAIFEALLRMEPGPMRSNALLQLAGLWATNEPRLASEIFYAQTSDEERKRGVAQTLSKWAKADPGAALKWLNDTVDEAPLRAQLRTQLYSAWTLNDPSGAVNNAISSAVAGSELNSIFSSWAAADLDDAAKFHHEKLPADLQKQTRPSLLLAAAAQKSPLAEALFTEYLASNPTWGELADMGKVLSATHPKLALRAAEQLSPSPEADLLRLRVSSLHPGVSPSVAVIEDSQEAGIPAASRVNLPTASPEISNSVPR